jgi:tetratricopeptide (TPR) repeat protein
MQYLENSVKAHDIMGNFLKKRIELELQKPVNVAKFLMPDIQRTVNHFKRAVEIWPGHVSSWVNLGIIYNNPRISEHLLARGDTNEYRRFKRSAISSFKRALELEENEDALFNLGFTYEATGKMDSAVFYYEQCITSNPQTIYPRSKLANLKFMQGKVDEALELNRQIIYIDPNESLPYLNFGNYYMMMGDTLKSIMNYEEAAVRNARPEVFAFLARYYTSQGNQLKANEYTQKYNNAKASD